MTSNSTPSQKRRWPVRILLGALGVLAALGGAELLFRNRDHGAFPHLNTYVADATLGVRLRPGAHEAIRFGGPQNPITQVTIGPEGFREPLSADAKTDILVVGDSQVFGLGVEAGETFSHVLGETLSTHPHVQNLGVPTYGPDEYLAVLEEQLRTRNPATLVYAVNLVNDLFEATRPNVQRHGVLDGWAVRKERMPPTSTWPLPMRQHLLGESHLVYAWRRTTEGSSNLASEGGYGDLVDVAQATVQAEQHAKDDFDRGSRTHSAEEDAAYLEFAKQDAVLAQTLFNQVKCEGQGTVDDSFNDVGAQATHETFLCGVLDPTAKAGQDLDLEPQAEESRTVRVTAEHLRRAAWMRAYLEDNAKAIAEVETIPAVKAAAQKRNAARDAYYAVRGGRPKYRAAPTPLSPVLEKLATLGKAHETRVVVLVLPIDVAVSPTEWAKYGETKPVDLSIVNQFARAITEQSTSLGMEALDTTSLLAAAEPGAFLDGDIHLTPKGHRAVATGLAHVLEAPPVVAEAPVQLEGQMTGVTYASLKSWDLTHKTCVAFAAPAGHLSVACPLTQIETLVGQYVGGGGPLGGITFVDRAAGDVLAGTVGNLALFHVVAATPAHVLFQHGERARPITLAYTRGLPTAFGESLVARPQPAQLALTESDPKFVACAKELPNDDLGPADADCIRTYAGTCRLMLACSRGADYARPKCADGFVPTGAFGRCLARP